MPVYRQTGNLQLACKGQINTLKHNTIFLNIVSLSFLFLSYFYPMFLKAESPVAALHLFLAIYINKILYNL